MPQREVADLVRDGEAPAALALLGPVEDGRQRPVLLSEQEAVRPVDMLGQVVPAQELIPLCVGVQPQAKPAAHLS